MIGNLPAVRDLLVILAINAVVLTLSQAAFAQQTLSGSSGGPQQITPAVNGASRGNVVPSGFITDMNEQLVNLETTVSRFHRNLQDKLQLQIHGLLAGTFEYNFDRPNTGNNLFRVYDYFGAQSFELAQAELYLERSVPGQIGFVLDLNTANTAQVQYGSVTTYWRVPGPDGGCPQSPCGWLDPTRAYIDYTLSVGSGIQLIAGSQYSLIGYEVIPSWQNYNLFQSIGLLFHYSPFTVTGLRAHYAFTDEVGLTLGLTNGWNTIASTYPLQGFEGQLALAPVEALSLTISGMYGPTGGNLPSKSGLLDGASSWRTPIDELSIGLEGQVGHQDTNALAPTPIIEGPENPSNPILDEFPRGRTVHPSNWWGEGTWLSYQMTPTIQLGLRGEVFRDNDGFLTGLPQTLWEITAGFNFQITKSLLWRVEYRHDESSQKPFPSDKAFVTFPCPGLGFCESTASTYHGMDTTMTTLLFTF